MIVFAEKGVNGLPVPETRPMTTGVPVTASGRVTVIELDPNEGRLVATTESPETTIVGPPPVDADGAACAVAEAQSTPALVSTAAAGPIQRRSC